MKIKRTGRFYVYIVECSDKTFYTGYTPDLARRIGLHNAGKGAKYTRFRRPVELVAESSELSKGDALKLEYFIKKQSKQDKVRALKERAKGIEHIHNKKKKGCRGQKRKNYLKKTPKRSGSVYCRSFQQFFRYTLKPCKKEDNVISQHLPDSSDYY